MLHSNLHSSKKSLPKHLEKGKKKSVSKNICKAVLNLRKKEHIMRTRKLGEKLLCPQGYSIMGKLDNILQVKSHTNG